MESDLALRWQRSLQLVAFAAAAQRTAHQASTDLHAKRVAADEVPDEDEHRGCKHRAGPTEVRRYSCRALGRSWCHAYSFFSRNECRFIAWSNLPLIAVVPARTKQS